MLNLNNVNPYQPMFAGSKIKLNKSLDESLEIFKDKILSEEKYIRGYLAPEVIAAIEDKFYQLKLKANNIGLKHEKDLIKPLNEAICGNYDITETYLALGEFEKKLSQINIVG